ncbi:MAG: phenylalanine--tRNA ligase subunit beta [Myxococcota bacterium]|nr:phenylalanine--tRNA ligase subunit beta [Myxococcota bacterium]
MKASVRWLRELCPQLPDDAKAIAARLTAGGLEVEAKQAFGLGAEACQVVAVIAVRPHPSRSGLKLVTIDRGGAEQVVVCGAPNVPEPGGLVVLAPLGAHLEAKAMTVQARTIAGVPSEGMLCSETELGLGDEAEGILVLPPRSAAPGTPLVRALPASRDTVLELGLTPNRPDALGHLGLAREAAALFDIPFAWPSPAAPVPARDEALSPLVTITIEDPERCLHYGAAVLDEARVAPSSLAIRWRLSSLGFRPISNVVDVTNLVMLELGHPMHAFDLEKVRGGKIVVRRALEGERLLTLDGEEHALVPDDLVIADGGGPLALAGVMGGRLSEITAATTQVLLECAYFEPRGIRRAARRHGLHTESSHRFERGVDWGDTGSALARASSLLVEHAGATAIEEPRIIEASALARRTVALRPDRVGALLGVPVDAEESSAILLRLGFARRARPPGVDVWEVPSHRPDVSREVDLIEEVARVRGYDVLPATLPAVPPTRDNAPRDALARRARQVAIEMGLSEAVTFSFVDPKELEAVGAPPPAVVLRNPLAGHQSAMRTSLLPGLLRNISRARRHGEADARLFCVGTRFLATDAQAPEERLAFASVLAGSRTAWLRKPEPVDVWDAKGLAVGLLRRLVRREATVHLAGDERPQHLHPRGAAWIDVEGKRVGALGPLHPDVVDAFDLGQAVMVVEVDLAGLAAIGVRSPVFIPLPRFPSSTRDIAVIVPEGVPAGQVERVVREAAGDLAEKAALFDRFVGGPIPPGHASLAMHVVYRAPDRTLTDSEVDERHAGVLAEVQRRFGAQLR